MIAVPLQITFSQICVTIATSGEKGHWCCIRDNNFVRAKPLVTAIGYHRILINTIRYILGTCELPIDASSMNMGILTYGTPSPIKDTYSVSSTPINKAYIDSNGNTNLLSVSHSFSLYFKPVYIILFRKTDMGKQLPRQQDIVCSTM